MWFLDRKIRKAEETIAYLEEKVDVLRRLCSSSHTSWDREDLVNSSAELGKSKIKLRHLLIKKQLKEERHKW